jgi:hypothetical protein
MKMGAVHPGIPIQLAKELRQAFSLATFVETGTYLGETSEWASSEFEHVITIEADAVLFHRAQDSFLHAPNIQCILGNSPDRLAEVLDSLREPAMIWLDAHWSGGTTHGEGKQCPLLEELQALSLTDIEHFVLIDDARLFLSPPPPPHLPKQWPNIAQIIELLLRGKQYFIVVVEDTIVAVPCRAQETVTRYCQDVNAVLEHDRLKRARRARIQRKLHPRRMFNRLTKATRSLREKDKQKQ